jgi:Na+/proline symporter
VKGFGMALLLGVVGYLVSAGARHFLVQQFSSNVHDRSLEAAMTAALSFAPAGAIIGFVAGVMMGGRSRNAPTSRT